MYNFNKDKFAEFMQREYGILVDKRSVGEESIILFKDELDEELISKRQMKRLPEQLMIHMCSYNEKSEWIVGVLCDVNAKFPLALICLKDSVQIYEKDLRKE